MTGRATAPRLLLLLFVLAGVAGMHTIGHPASDGHRSPDHATAATLVLAAAELEPAMPGDWRDQHNLMVMDPLTVCLAILAGGILLLLVAALCRLRRADRAAHHIMTASGRAGRGPPGFVPVGLTLADLSVQRT